MFFFSFRLFQFPLFHLLFPFSPIFAFFPFFPLFFFLDKSKKSVKSTFLHSELLSVSVPRRKIRYHELRFALQLEADQVFELCAQTSYEREQWVEMISKVIDPDAKRRSEERKALTRVLSKKTKAAAASIKR